jgi:hypothetical protein
MPTQDLPDTPCSSSTDVLLIVRPVIRTASSLSVYIQLGQKPLLPVADSSEFGITQDQCLYMGEKNRQTADVCANRIAG